MFMQRLLKLLKYSDEAKFKALLFSLALSIVALIVAIANSFCKWELIRRWGNEGQEKNRDKH